MGKKSDPPKPPDLTPQAEASEEIARINQETAREQLAWAREQDTLNRQILDRVLGVQLPIMEETFANAQSDRERYERVFQPVEDNLVKEFQNYDSPQRLDMERGRAIADVSSAFEAQRRNAAARLESYGIDPSQTRSMALDIGMRTAQAAAQASAADAATQRVENTGRALRADAINIGRGLPSQAAQSYGQSLSAGQAGIGGANATSANSANLANSSLGFTNAALGGYGQGANIRGSSYQNQLAYTDALNQNTMAPWNTAASLVGGVAGMAFLDKGGPVTEKGALPVPVLPGSTDRKPALLTPGEYVVPKDVVRFKGEEFFEKLIAKSRENKQQMTQERQGIPTAA
jgi:hypothetical protein